MITKQIKLRDKLFNIKIENKQVIKDAEYNKLASMAYKEAKNLVNGLIAQGNSLAVYMVSFSGFLSPEDFVQEIFLEFNSALVNYNPDKSSFITYFITNAKRNIRRTLERKAHLNFLNYHKNDPEKLQRTIGLLWPISLSAFSTIDDSLDNIIY